MTYEESIPLARELAENALRKSFDADAFIILTLLNKETVDDVPDSEVDDKIKYMYNLFLLYVTSHDKSVLDEFLTTNYRMIEELYHSASGPDEKDMFRQYTKNMLTLNGS